MADRVSGHESGGELVDDSDDHGVEVCDLVMQFEVAPANSALHIIAIGNQMTHILNGHVLSILIDEDGTKFHKSGKIGLEVEATGKLFTRNISLKKLN